MATDPNAALGGLAQAVQDEGGLDALVGKLREGGYGDKVDTWVSTGTNREIEPDELQQALGPEEVQRLSSKSGLDIKALLPMLAMFLPQIIDMVTPKGQVPEGGLNQAAQESMPDLGGLLGSLMGGSGGAGGLGDVLGGMLGGGNKPS